MNIRRPALVLGMMTAALLASLPPRRSEEDLPPDVIPDPPPEPHYRAAEVDGVRYDSRTSWPEDREPVRSPSILLGHRSRLPMPVEREPDEKRARKLAKRAENARRAEAGKAVRGG